MAVSDAAGARVAQRIGGAIDTFIESYEKAVLGTGDCMPASRFRELWQAELDAIVREVCTALSRPRGAPDATVGGSRVETGRRSNGPAWALGVHPSELLRAASLFLEVLSDAVTEAVASEEDAVAMMAVATQAAHRAVMARVRDAVTSHNTFLLSKIHDAHLEERARIARELHDRLGSAVSAAARCVESLRAYRDRDPSVMDKRIAQAEQSLHEAVDEIRQLTYDLRLQTQTSGLETALRYSSRTTAPVGLDTLVEVVGDESWASAAVLDELFLVLREAMRNAYSHAKAGRVEVRVEVTPYEVRASVADDGVGMDPSRRGNGLGLVTMHERVALMGGMIRIYSRPGAGTSVETRVPLSGGVDAS